MTTKDEAVAAAKRIKFEGGKLGPARDILAMAEYLLSIAETSMTWRVMTSNEIGRTTVWCSEDEPIADPLKAEAATSEQGG